MGARVAMQHRPTHNGILVCQLSKPCVVLQYVTQSTSWGYFQQTPLITYMTAWNTVYILFDTTPTFHYIIHLLQGGSEPGIYLIAHLCDTRGRHLRSWHSVCTGTTPILSKTVLVNSNINQWSENRRLNQTEKNMSYILWCLSIDKFY